MFLSKLILEAKEDLDKIKGLNEKIDYTKLVCVHTNGLIYDFNIFNRLGDFIRSIFCADVLIKEAINRKNRMETLMRDLDAYRRESPEKKSRKETLYNAHNCFRGRKLFVDTFENGIFPLLK